MFDRPATPTSGVLNKMAKRAKDRQSLQEILASCSDTLFPADLGNAHVNLNSADADGDTPLHVLLWRRNNHGVRVLIEAGAHVDAIGDMSEPPLHIAVRKNNVDAVTQLLRAGANPSLVSEFGQTPRDVAESIGDQVRALLRGA